MELLLLKQRRGFWRNQVRPSSDSHFGDLIRETTAKKLKQLASIHEQRQNHAPAGAVWNADVLIKTVT